LGGVAIASSLSLGLVLVRGVGVDALGIVVCLEDVLRGVSLVLGPGVGSNLLRLLVRLLLLLLIGRLLLLEGRPLRLLWLLEGLLLEGGLLVGRLDGLLGSWLVVSLLSAWLLLLVGRGRPLLLNLLEVLEATLLRSSCCWLLCPRLLLNLLEVLEATLLRFSCCLLCPRLLLPHSDHLSCRLWQRVGAWLQTLLRSLLPLPQLEGGEIPLRVVHILARFHCLRGVDAVLSNGNTGQAENCKKTRSHF